jgi:polygalacturonase
MVVLGACQDVVVRNLRELGAVGGTDGVDIVGSKRIRVENCFCRNGDDCIVVKSLDLRPHGRDATVDYSGDVEDIEVSGCAMMAYVGGQAMEIGHELRTASVRNIRFRDCDVLAVHGHGGVFGIHNADRATVSDVLYENIRVEHHYEKLVDFRIVKSRWSKDEQRGQIRNVTLRNIGVALSVFNPGYTCSVIGGRDARHTIQHVRFEDFRLDGKPVTSPDEMDLYCKQASDITFHFSGPPTR